MAFSWESKILNPVFMLHCLLIFEYFMLFVSPEMMFLFAQIK